MSEKNKSRTLIKKLLKREGYELIRTKNHFVFANKKSGAKIYVSGTPKCATREIKLVKLQLNRFKKNIFHQHHKHLEERKYG